MIVFPIVTRELLVASRRRGTYRLRVLAAALALVFCAITLITLAAVPSFAAAGQWIFAFLGWTGTIFALLVGVNATADCLSREKREGTFGLLFLTDLKGYDVVFGKLAAASLTVFYGLVAMLPVLALPLMLGGVTAGEYTRVALVWLNGLFFSISAGMAVSALSRDQRVALGNSFALVLALTLALPLMGMFAAAQTGSSFLAFVLGVPSPLSACYLAFETRFVAQGYWTSLAVTHALSWLLLWLACRAARSAWHDKAAKPQRQRLASLRWTEAAMDAKAFRHQALARNPVFWLLSRERHVRLYPWILVASMVGIWFWGRSFERPMFTLFTTILVGYVTHSLFKWWVATVACRSFAEERENVSMELLLSTPLRVAEIMRGTALASRRLFGWPAAVLVGLQLALLGFGLRQPRSDLNSGREAFMLLANVVVFLADCWAMHWVGLWMGFKSRQPTTAVWKTIFVVLVLPWLGVWAIVTLGMLANEAPETQVITTAWLLLSLLADLIFGLGARFKVTRDLRTLALMRLSGKDGRGGEI